MTNATIAKQAIDQMLIAKANVLVFHPAGFALVVRGSVDEVNEELITPDEIYLTTHVERDSSPARIATCIMCKCSDDNACPGGCSWILVSYEHHIGICSNCLKTHLHKQHKETTP